MGELAIRASTARSLVLYLKMGMSLREAGEEALRDLDFMGSEPGRYMNIVALTPDGESRRLHDRARQAIHRHDGGLWRRRNCTTASHSHLRRRASSRAASECIADSRTEPNPNAIKPSLDREHHERLRL